MTKKIMIFVGYVAAIMGGCLQGCLCLTTRRCFS